MTDVEVWYRPPGANSSGTSNEAIVRGFVGFVGFVPAGRVACRSVRLFVYVVVHDSGFAPNPFFGYCTLATCKPRIRGTAAEGDWIAGVGSVQRGQEGRLVYAMRVAEAMDFDEYSVDPRFARKRPIRDGDARQRCGDNIYHRDPGSGDWIQDPGRHSNKDVCRDTSAPRVQIGKTSPTSAQTPSTSRAGSDPGGVTTTTAGFVAAGANSSRTCGHLRRVARGTLRREQRAAWRATRMAGRAGRLNLRSIGLRVDRSLSRRTAGGSDPP